MRKRVIVINGSLRVNGNTDAILKSLLEGAQSTDILIQKFVLRELEINGCKGCYYCYENNTCSIKDDMLGIHHEIQLSDLIILASPMYWWGVTGLMKTFIDRLYLYYPKSNGHLVAGKKLILIVPMNVNEEQHGHEAYISEIGPIQTTSKYIFKRLNIQILDIIFYPGLLGKGEAVNNKEYLDHSYNLGQELIHLVRGPRD